MPERSLAARAAGRLRRRLRTRAVVPELAAFEAVARLLRDGATPLAPAAPEAAERERLRLAVVIPWYPPGSGGHATIFNLVRALEARGHACSVWLDDPEGRHAARTQAQVAAELRELFGGCAGPVHVGFAAWGEVDVAIATSWPTAYRVRLLPGCRVRAYLVQDHEPEFHPTSAQAEWAADSYRAGLHCIAASGWLAQLLRERYGAAASSFDLGVDHDVYRARPAAQAAAERVLFYARASTERRAVPLGLMALEELHRRRPGVELALFGRDTPLRAPFPHRHLGRLGPAELADAYRQASVGMVLSMTNVSLVPLEMLACGLPCVDLDRPSTRTELGPSDAVELAAFHPRALADALQRLLEDEALRERRARAGVAWVGERTWARAAEQVEAGLRTALRRCAADRGC
ncbi:MAG: glycosyltransferase family 4 protein [Conexibacter sp.]